MTRTLFCARLEAALLLRNLKPCDLAKVLGCSRSDISKYLDGSIPKPERLTEIARALRVTEAWLRGENAPIEPYPLYGDLARVAGFSDYSEDIFLLLGEAQRSDREVVRRVTALLRTINESNNGGKRTEEENPES